MEYNGMEWNQSVRSGTENLFDDGYEQYQHQYQQYIEVVVEANT